MKTTFAISLFIYMTTIAFSQQAVTLSDKSIMQGEGLAKLAQAVRPGFLLGSFASGLDSPDKEVLKGLFKNEFNIMTIGVYMKSSQPQTKSFRLERIDELVEFAQQNNIVVYLHPLIGGAQYTADWVNNGNFTASELKQIMRERITTILTRYGNKIQYADVVNEALLGLDSAGNIIWDTNDHVWLTMGWYEGKKYRMPNYLVDAFRIAREAGDKNLKLIYNQDTPNTNISDATFKLIKAMKFEGIPIDGVGIQLHMHLLENGDVIENGADKKNLWTQEGFAAVLERYRKAGIEVHITEFDVHIQKQPASPEHLEIQAKIYRQALETAIKSPAVKTFKTWGFTDKYSWKQRNFDATPLLFDKSFAPKPAYKAQVQLLKDLGKKK